jgi:hypothetical protein
VPTNDEVGELIVTSDSRAVKRGLGVTAWAVLEDVVLDARLEEGRWLARTSVRLVAHHLGLTPGTVARALARLCSEGLVHREDRRDVDTGRFGESVYVVHPAAALHPCRDVPNTAQRDTAAPQTVVPPMEERRTEPPPVALPLRVARRRRAADPVQLPLLDDEPPASDPRPFVPPSPPLTTPVNPNPHTPTTHQPDHPPSNSTQPPDPTTERPTDSCHPSGKALPGGAAFSREAGSC